MSATNPARIYIAIPVHNRLAIARECIRTVSDSLLDGCNRKHMDTLAIFNDGSDGFSTHDFDADEFHQSTKPIGIEAQRRHHFTHFWNQCNLGRDYTHLYLCDSDSLHDPAWRSTLLDLQAQHGGKPICGYNTAAHSRLEGNTIEDDPDSRVIWRRVAPGISYLLTRYHVEKVVAALPHLPEHWHFDWTVPALLGHRFAVTRQSVVEHIGVGGLHHDEDAGWEGGDRATNPCPYLVE